MAATKKEQQQVMILVGVLVIIVGVLLYSNADKLLPKPEPTEEGAAPARLALPSKLPTDVLDRSDFQTLTPFGDLPIRPMLKGSKDIFKPIK